MQNTLKYVRKPNTGGYEGSAKNFGFAETRTDLKHFRGE